MKRKVILFMTAICAMTAMAKSKSEVTTKDWEVAAFTEVIVNGPFDVTFSQGVTEQVITTSDHTELLDVRSIDGKLVLSVNNRNNANIRTLKAVITAPNISSITITRAATWDTKGVLQADELKLVADHASTMEINTTCIALEVQSKEASTLIVQGRADQLTLTAAGASTCNAADLQTTEAAVVAKGASSVSVNAQTLSMEAYSASTIRYVGEPKIISQIAHSASDIRKK